MFLLKKLKTKEDPHHLHKTLGIFCLFNYVYRYYLLLSVGNMRLNNLYGILSILVHAALSLSSLIFYIPLKRNPLKPMIYPEYRLHSIIFALRSVYERATLFLIRLFLIFHHMPFL